MATAYNFGNTTTYVSASLKGRNSVPSARPFAPVHLHLRVYEFSDGGRRLACRPEFTDFFMYLGQLVDARDLNSMILVILSHTCYNDLDTRRFWEEKLTDYSARAGLVAFSAGVQELELTVVIHIRNRAQRRLEVEMVRYISEEGIGAGDFGGVPASEASIKELAVVKYNDVVGEFEVQPDLRSYCAESFSLAEKCRRFDYIHTADQLVVIPNSWKSLVASASTQKILFISWKPPPLGFVKVNFDGSVKNARGGAGFIIRDSDARLLAAGGFPLSEPSVLEAELHAAWAGIIYASQVLRAKRILIEGDSTTVINWIQNKKKTTMTHPLLCDIWKLLLLFTKTSIRHVYREVNGAADWVASFVRDHSGDWTWRQGDVCPLGLQDILFYDSLGRTHIRRLRSF